MKGQHSPSGRAVHSAHGSGLFLTVVRILVRGSYNWLRAPGKGMVSSSQT